MMLRDQNHVLCSRSPDGMHPLLWIELRGSEYLWVSRAISPFTVQESIGAEVDDHSKLEVLPLDLLR